LRLNPLSLGRLCLVQKSLPERYIGLVSQQAPPAVPVPVDHVDEKPLGSRLNVSRVWTRISGVTGSAVASSITWPIIYVGSVILVLVLVAALVLLPILVFGGERPASVKGYLDAITWGWLALNGVPPKLGSATITLIPWGLAVIPWILLFRAGRSLAVRNRHGVRWQVVGGVIMVVLYVAVVVGAAHLTTSINVSFGTWWALTVSVMMGVSAVSIGILRGADVHLELRIPALLLFVARRGAASVLALLGLAATLLALRLLVNFGSAMDLFVGLNPGWSGILGILALTLGYLPVLVVWSAAYVVGAGFSIGPDVMVSPFIAVTAPTQLPPFPPLVAIPETAGALAWLLPVLVVVIGVMWGVGISKSLAKESALIRLVIGFAIALVGAVIFAVLAVLSLGDLGDVRLVDLGPDPILSASLFWILLAVGITPTAILPAKTFTRHRRSTIAVVPEVDVQQSQVKQ